MTGMKGENKNYRRVNSCEFCKKLDCEKRAIDMTCDDFEDAGLYRKIPGFPAMSPRDWEILGS